VRRRRARVLAPAALVAIAAALALDASDALQRIEEQTLDARFAVRGERDPPPGIVVVGVDEATITPNTRRSGRRWPFPRREQAALLDRVRRAEPRLIVYDVALTEPSGDDAADLALFDAIKRARPVLLAGTETNARGETAVLGNPDNVREAAATVGSSLFPLDRDGAIRRVDAEVGGLPALAVQAVGLVGRRSSIRRGESAWIDFAGKPGTVLTYSWEKVARGQLQPGVLRNRIVVIGTTAKRLHDVHDTSAGGEQMPGPEIQANAIDTLLRGAPLRGASGTVDSALVVGLALLVPLLALWLGLPALLIAPPALAALAGAGQLSFEDGTIIALAAPAAALLLGAAAATIALAATEVRDRRRLRATFARFVPADVVDALADEAHESGGLPATQLDATVMFCDLRGFTTFAEGRAPAGVIATLNDYLAGVSDAVLGHGGTVVAFLGDGVMSVFGAPVSTPDHADRALAAAREIAGPRLEALNAARAGEEPFRLGIGLNSGPVMSGTVGSKRRMEYAAIGDTTNLAARVQALTKEHATPILLTAATRERLSRVDDLRRVGHVPIRGRAAPAELYAPGTQR